MDNKQKSRRLRKEIIKKSAKLALVLAIIPLLLALFHVTHPYFYSFKWLKLLMYSLTFLLPVIIDTFIGLAGVHTAEPVFYAMLYLFYLILYFCIIWAYLKVKHKRRFIYILIGCVVLFAAGAVFLLW